MRGVAYEELLPNCAERIVMMVVANEREMLKKQGEVFSEEQA